MIRTTRKEIIEMLKVLKEQALKSHNDTAIIDVKKDSFIYVMNAAIKELEQEPCKDAISRQAVLEIQVKYAEHIGATTFWQMRDDIKALSPVTPQQKIGHWINTDEIHSKCDRCGAVFEIVSANGDANFCPNCGAKMQEVEA